MATVETWEGERCEQGCCGLVAGDRVQHRDGRFGALSNKRKHTELGHLVYLVNWDGGAASWVAYPTLRWVKP